MSKNHEYSAKNIVNITPKDHLRERPNLTFGDERGSEQYPYSTMKSVAVREVIDNSVSEKMIGVADYIRIIFHKDRSFTCVDNGRGIPVDIGKTAYGEEASGVYLAIGLLQSGSSLKNQDKDRIVNSANGLGASATNYMSEWFKVKVFRNNRIYYLDFLDGEAGFFDDSGNFTPVKNKAEIRYIKDNRPKEEKEIFKTGTHIHFKLNDSLFYNDYPVDIEDLTKRAEGVTFLYPGLTFEVIDENIEDTQGNPKKSIFRYDGGIKEFLKTEKSKNLISEIHDFHISTEFKEKKRGLTYDRMLKIDFAFSYNSGYEYDLDSYCNSIRTTKGGVHVSSFEKAVTEVFNSRIKSMKGGLSKKDPDITFKDIAEGLNLVLAIGTNEPKYIGQEKQEVSGVDLKKAIEESIKDALETWVKSPKAKEDFERISSKIILAMKNRTRIQEQQQVAREQNKIKKSTSMPSKLFDCEFTHTEDSELYIAEGDSASWALKPARDSRHQAILPVRGKIKNASKAGLQDTLKNEEVQDIIKCMGTGILNDFKEEELRYKRVFIATDADYDGMNIACLLLVLFWEIYPDFVKQGRLYRILTPLFIVREIRSKKEHFCFSDKEYEECIKQLKEAKITYNVVRAKGLGETGKDILYETGMNPETRTIQRIVVKDIEQAKKYLEIAMGTDTAPRKEWILQNPEYLLKEED